MKTMNMSRRGFLKTTGIVGGGLVVGFNLQSCSSDEAPALVGGAGEFTPNAFFQIRQDNSMYFVCPRDEMGQGVTTGLTTIACEELDVDPEHMEIGLAGAHSDYSVPGLGIQGTGGSMSVTQHWEQLRQVGAATRHVIIQAAAQDLGVSASAITTDNGHIVANGKRYPYGQFVETAAGIAMPELETVSLKSVEQFKYVGRDDTTRLDALAKATGTADYGIDAEVDGMHYAMISRSPVPGASLVSVDKSVALNAAGVTDVVEVSAGIAVVAESFWQAKKAVALLKPKWESIELNSVSNDSLKADYQAEFAKEKGVKGENEGDVAAAFEAAKATVETEFWTPFLAHAPMETPNALVHLQGDKAEVWTGNQGPGGVAGLVARTAGIDAANVKVHGTYMGGAFGRRATLNYVSEATEIAVATNKPIKLVWSREEDLQNATYRPASLMNIKASVDDKGIVNGWHATRVGGNIMPETLNTMLPSFFPGMPDGVVNGIVGTARYAFKNWTADNGSVEGLAGDYDLPNHEVRQVTVSHGLPLTFWRSVGHSFTAFAKEVTMDQLAEKAGQDPVAFRLANTTNNPRMHNVIKTAGELMNSMNVPAGRALGFASHQSFKTDVAQIAEVSVEAGNIRVHKVTCVVDCGTAVNPDIVRSQVEGAIMFGLTAALHGELTLQDGAFTESNFHNYPILRMNEAPEVKVVIIENSDHPTGIGEPGLPPVAPAVANAVYAATGQRLTSLPLKLA